MRATIEAVLGAIFMLCLIAFVVWVSWSWYTTPCDEIKDNIFLSNGYAPARCIR